MKKWSTWNSIRKTIKDSPAYCLLSPDFMAPQPQDRSVVSMSMGTSPTSISKSTIALMLFDKMDISENFLSLSNQLFVQPLSQPDTISFFRENLNLNTTFMAIILKNSGFSKSICMTRQTSLNFDNWCSRSFLEAERINPTRHTSIILCICLPILTFMGCTRSPLWTSNFGGTSTNSKNTSKNSIRNLWAIVLPNHYLTSIFLSCSDRCPPHLVCSKNAAHAICRWMCTSPALLIISIISCVVARIHGCQLTVIWQSMIFSKVVIKIFKLKLRKP